MRKAVEKQTKAMEDQGKNQISAIKESEKQIIKSNEIAKNVLILTEVVFRLINKNKYLMNLQEKKLKNFLI